MSPGGECVTEEAQHVSYIITAFISYQENTVVINGIELY